MSTVESANDSRLHYLTEAADRLGEQSAAWGLPRLIATMGMMDRQEEAARRQRESYNLEAQLHAKTLGLDLAKAQADGRPEANNEMGQLHVQGDTTNHYHAEPAKAASPGVAGKVATVAGSALLGAAVPAGLLLWQSLGGGGEQPASEPQTVITQPADQQDWRLDLEVIPSE